MWPFEKHDDPLRTPLAAIERQLGVLEEVIKGWNGERSLAERHLSSADVAKMRADIDDLFTLFRRLNGRVNQLVGAKAEKEPPEESPLEVRRKLRGM